MDKKIIEKIMKVYNKSKNNPSEHEAKAAILKVQEMLVKYNLEMKDLSVKEDYNVEQISSGQRSRWWHGRLGNILAENFKCKMYTITSRGRAIVFIGRKTDVNICLETFNYTKKAINYNCKIHMAKRRFRKKENIKMAKESFIEGFIYGLSRVLDEQKNKNNWGLVLQVPAEVQDYYNSIKFTGTVDYRRNDKETDEKAYMEGYIRGKEFEINPGKILINE